jgi:hypothetical protein
LFNADFPEVVADSSKIEFIDDMHIRATFNLADVPESVFHLKVVNPDKNENTFYEAFRVNQFEGKELAFNSWQDITVPPGSKRLYGINVPDNTFNLYFLVRKSTKIGHHGTWTGNIRVFRQGTLIHERSGMEDFDLQLKNAKGGRYYVEILANDDAQAQIKVCDHFDILRPGEWHKGLVLKGWGHDWTQITIPANTDTLFFETQGFGIYSNMHVFYDSLTNRTDHWFFDNYRNGYHLEGKIPKPKAGTFIFKYEDSDNVVGGSSQERDYLLNVDMDSIKVPPYDQKPNITSLSVYEVGKGPVTIEIFGSALDSAFIVGLINHFNDTILAEKVRNKDEFVSIQADFDLALQDTGFYDLILIKANQIIAKSPKQVKIEEAKPPNLQIEILGRDIIRVGRETTYTVKYKNLSNVNLYNYEISLIVWNEVLYTNTKIKSSLTIPEPAFYSSVPAGTIFPGAVGSQIFKFIPPFVICGNVGGGIGPVPPVPNWGGGNGGGDDPCKRLWEQLAEINKLIDYLEAERSKLISYYWQLVEWQNNPNITYEYWLRIEKEKWHVFMEIKTLENRINDLQKKKKEIEDEIARKCQFKSANITDYDNSFGNSDLLSNSSFSYKPYCSAGSSTPEDKYGTTGFGQYGQISKDQKLTYKIDFWNHEKATAPAQQVFIKDTLDVNLNDTTLAFTEIGFLRWKLPLKAGNYFNVNVDMRPDMNLIVNVVGNYNYQNREISLTYTSLDTATMQLTDEPLLGFLPPIDSTGYQIGWVEYQVEPKKNLPTGTKIKNQAWVNFDGVGPTNPAPKGAPWTNTIDAVPPVSYVLPEILHLDSTAYRINWTGYDDPGGSGIKAYSVYVSDNGSPYRIWLLNTLDTTAIFNAAVGHIYRFYSVARDGAGNVEGIPSEFDAFIQIGQNAHTLNLTAGWNIFSIPVLPENIDILSLSQPLNSAGALIKIQDENGNSVEDMGVLGGWKNDIGNIALSEGYKIKVKKDCQLLLSGIPAVFPFKIPIKTGWNIIGYPRFSDADALAVIQQLIDRKKLIKVQDEKGNSIEDLGVFGGWTNNIGTFKPGKGFKAKVTANETLTIYESYLKSSVSPLSPLSYKTVYFKPATPGNGVDHMNINLVDIPAGIEPGDEIAVFDGDLCINSMVIGNRYSVIGLTNPSTGGALDSQLHQYSAIGAEKSQITNHKSQITNHKSK